MTAEAQPAKRAVPQNGPARRRAILDCALALLVERGFEGLRVRDVALAADINQATLIYHYADKEHLIAALVADIIGRFRAINERLSSSLSPGAALDAHFASVREHFIEAPGVYVVLAECAVRARRHEAIASVLATSHARWAEFIASLMRDAAPDAASERVAHLAQTTVTFFNGVGLRWGVDGTLQGLMTRGRGLATRERRVRTTIDAFLRLVHRELGIR